MLYNVSGDFRMDEQFVSIGKAAKMLGMSTEGLRKWDREGRLIPVRTVTNHRRYRVTDLRALMHENVQNPALDARCILYARVSTKKQPDAGNLSPCLGMGSGDSFLPSLGSSTRAVSRVRGGAAMDGGGRLDRCGERTQ